MVKVAKDNSTEEKILEAARKIFVHKGMTGARMQEIADAAGINKAMLHYYFRNKEMLFETIFSQAAQKLFPQLNIIFESDLPLFEKIENFVQAYMDVMIENPYLPMFVLTEMHQNPERFYKKMKGEMNFPKPDKFLAQIEKEVKRGTIKRISPLQLLMNIISGTIFPFIAKPMFQMHIGLDELQFRQFITQRKKEYAGFVIDAIRK
ncbi:MAG: TetR/AcrR family transcriptional regulator [Chitinophagaceae bacterium]|nr:TetR/AcrR family transcriptional regulator [Chitinophagaceae bacterium]